MSLVKKYCKEVQHALGQFAIYHPGRNVQLGDVITYQGNGFGSRPIGNFKVITNLEQLSGVIVESRLSPHADNYQFTSRSGVDRSFSTNSYPPNANSGDIKISFNRTGSIFIAALECHLEEVINLQELGQMLLPHTGVLDWDSCYIVAAITRAERAIIMQSNSKQGELVISGSANAATPGGIGGVMNTQIQVKGYKDASFIKDWSDEAPIFFSLIRFKRNFWGNWKMNTGLRRLGHADIDHRIERVFPEDVYDFESEPV
jgi:hypothetical protein